ncbi:MAG: hypothetical protein AB7N76_28965 [Planctomycetota bacterium]
MIFGLLAAFLASAAVYFLVFVPDQPERSSDPSRQGPTRSLSVAVAELVSDSSTSLLHVSGESNLPSGAKLEIEITEPQASRPYALLNAEVREGRFDLRERAAGGVSPGTYRVVVRFRIGSQTPALQEEVHFQPGLLEAQGQLVVLAASNAAAPDAHAKLRGIFEAVNLHPSDPAEITRLDKELLAFERAVWISREKEAIRALRLALEVARRPGHSREDFERHLLRAHVLGGL